MEDITSPIPADSADVTDKTDTSLITDFTQVVSCAVGLDRAERRREKIRRELIEQYFSDRQAPPATLVDRLRKLLANP